VDREERAVPSERSELQILDSIDKKLDQVIGLLAIQGKDKDGQMGTLYALGFDSSSIAAIVGVTPGYVRAWKSRRARA
jgi:hypothetical protein